MLDSRSRRFKERSTRQLAWFHRWLGIATCLIFALWFASGAVLIYKPFPGLPHAAQLGLQRDIDLAAVKITPAQAIAAAGGQASAVRLVDRGGSPAWLIARGGRQITVDARSGAVLPLIGEGEAARIAASLAASLAPRATASGPFDYDQWIVHNRFDPWRPFYRIDLRDEAGTALYLSARTGELLQRTTRSDRGWNWVGAVLHWVYFTPLRSSFTAWDRTVWWVSLACFLVAIAGTILGVIHMLAARRLPRPSLSFYRLRWMRWHHILGLFASLFVLSWMMSGWLSMDHGRFFSRGQMTPEQEAAFAGATLDAAAAGVGLDRLRGLGQAREIDMSVIAGQPLVTMRGPDGAAHSVGVDGQPIAPATLASAGIARAWPGATVVGLAPVAATDTYALAEGWPKSTLIATLSGKAAPSIAVDGEDGHVLTVMSDSRATYAWIYYAVHTLNFPGLSSHPWLRQSLELVLMIIGFAFSVTGAVIGFQRLRKNIAPRTRGLSA